MVYQGYKFSYDQHYNIDYEEHPLSSKRFQHQLLPYNFHISICYHIGSLSYISILSFICIVQTISSVTTKY
nr:MAG TPA: hypothetical protein [Bacteriophage sp.]